MQSALNLPQNPLRQAGKSREESRRVQTCITKKNRLRERSAPACAVAGLLRLSHPEDQLSAGRLAGNPEIIYSITPRAHVDYLFIFGWTIIHQQSQRALAIPTNVEGSAQNSEPGGYRDSKEKEKEEVLNNIRIDVAALLPADRGY
jgi:hypothetical protein